MSTPCSTPSPSRRNSRFLAAAVAAALALTGGPVGAAPPQQVVFDPRNHLENALQASRQLQSLTNEARMLAAQARQLAASPYSHLGETSAALRDIGELASEVRGVATTVSGLQAQFDDLYPTAVEGLDPRNALAQSRRRTQMARDTAEDVARTAAELERLSAGRARRLEGAVAASQAAEGQTAAIQSSTQVLVLLAEDLATMRTALLAQSRLMAEATARDAAERAAAAEGRRRFYARRAGPASAPAFDPFTRARN